MGVTLMPRHAHVHAPVHVHAAVHVPLAVVGSRCIPRPCVHAWQEIIGNFDKLCIPVWPTWMHGRSKAHKQYEGPSTRRKSLMMQLWERAVEHEQTMLAAAFEGQHGVHRDHDLEMKDEEFDRELREFEKVWKKHRETYNKRMQELLNQDVDEESRHEKTRHLQECYRDLFQREAAHETALLARNSILWPRARVLYTLSYREAHRKMQKQMQAAAAQGPTASDKTAADGTLAQRPSVSFPWAVAGEKLLEWKSMQVNDRKAERLRSR